MHFRFDGWFRGHTAIMEATSTPYLDIFLLSVAGCLCSPIRNMCGKKHVCRTILFLQNDSVLLRGENC
jgi:hypothetical protein